MRVLMISGDPRILIEGSETYARLELQRTQVERLDVFVWPLLHSWREIFLTAQKNAYDVVTAQDPFWRGLLVYIVARRNDARFNLQVHTDLSVQPFLRRRLAYFLLRRADSVRVVSQKIKDFLTPLHLRATISILPIYVDTARFSNLSHRPHPSFKKTILWVGRFEPEKDPLLVLSILKTVRDSGIDAGLILLGAGSLEKILHERAKSLTPYVEFPGWQDPARYLEMADVCISTSNHESYGASMLQALASGVPVVSPDVGVAREAGAIIVERSDIARTVCDVLQNGTRGELKMTLSTQEDWAKQWKETLI